MWMWYSLTDQNKLDHVCGNFFTVMPWKGELYRIVTGNEKWIVYDNVQSNWHWKQACECAEYVFKTSLHPMIVLLSVWWDCRGIIQSDLIPAGETITQQSTVTNSPILIRLIKKNGRVCKIEMVSFSTTTMQDCMLQNRHCRSLESWNGKPSNTNHFLPNRHLWIFICSSFYRTFKWPNIWLNTLSRKLLHNLLPKKTQVSLKMTSASL